MSKELDERCAALLGWHKGARRAINAGAGYESPAYWYDADGRQWGACATDDFANLHAFSASSNLFDAKLLEDAIERRGSIPEYMAALERITGVDTLTYTGRFLLIRATPEQRARAFIAVHTEELPQ